MEETPDHSMLVGPTKMGRMCGKSRDWAQNRMKEWLAEQNIGGPKRVWLHGKQRAMRTTMAVVQREFLGAVRDPVIMRKLKDQDQAIDFLTKRLDTVTTELHAIRARLGMKRAS